MVMVRKENNQIMKNNNNPPSWFRLAEQLIPFTKKDETHNMLQQQFFTLRNYKKT